MAKVVYDTAYLQCGREYRSTYRDKADKKFKLFFRLHCKNCAVCRDAGPIVDTETFGSFNPNIQTALMADNKKNDALDANPIYQAIHKN
jgi:hypothetical protein